MKNYTCKIAEMEYGNADQHCLAKGIYKDHKFAVLNIKGMHPCGYVDAKGTKFEGKDYDNIYGVDCHGGLTYSSSSLDGFDEGWWLGWDYGHFNDYTSVHESIGGIDYLMLKMFESEDSRDIGYPCGNRHTTSEVIAECKHVIDQIV